MTEGRKSGVALLVGAGDAIGAAVARRFAAGGYSVCVARRNSEKSQSLAQEIAATGGIARAVSADVRIEETVQALFAEVEAELGPVEVLPLQRRRQCQVAVDRDQRQAVLQGMGVGLLCRLSDRP